MRILRTWLLASLTCTSLLIGCAPRDGAQSDTILIGIASEPYPPFSEKAANGEWQGWEIEISKAICAEMEKDCKYVEIAWDGLIPALQSGKIDIIMASMSITEERMRTLDFSDKYYDTPAVIVAPKESDISDVASSAQGKIFGVQVATTHAEYIEKYFSDFIDDVNTYQSLDEHNQDLAAGRIDAVIADSIAMQSFLDSRAGQCCEIKAELYDADIFGLGAGFGLRKDVSDLKEEINAAIAQIRTDGTYASISAKYFDFSIYGAD